MYKLFTQIAKKIKIKAKFIHVIKLYFIDNLKMANKPKILVVFLAYLWDFGRISYVTAYSHIFTQQLILKVWPDSNLEYSFLFVWTTNNPIRQIIFLKIDCLNLVRKSQIMFWYWLVTSSQFHWRPLHQGSLEDVWHWCDEVAHSVDKFNSYKILSKGYLMMSSLAYWHPKCQVEFTFEYFVQI